MSIIRLISILIHMTQCLSTEYHRSYLIEIRHNSATIYIYRPVMWSLNGVRVKWFIYLIRLYRMREDTSGRGVLTIDLNLSFPAVSRTCSFTSYVSISLKQKNILKATCHSDTLSLCHSVTQSVSQSVSATPYKSLFSQWHSWNLHTAMMCHFCVTT